MKNVILLVTLLTLLLLLGTSSPVLADDFVVCAAVLPCKGAEVIAPYNDPQSACYTKYLTQCTAFALKAQEDQLVDCKDSKSKITKMYRRLMRLYRQNHRN